MGEGARGWMVHIHRVVRMVEVAFSVFERVEMWASGVLKRVDIGFRMPGGVEICFGVLGRVWKSASECLER